MNLAKGRTFKNAKQSDVSFVVVYGAFSPSQFMNSTRFTRNNVELYAWDNVRPLEMKAYALASYHVENRANIIINKVIIIATNAQ